MPGRGNLQPVGAVDRIGDVEHRRQRARDGLAILDRHRAVRPLGHDLHGAAVDARKCARAPADSRGSSSTGSAMAATRAPGPARRSGAARRPAAFATLRSSVRRCLLTLDSADCTPVPGPSRVTKKSGSRGTHSQKPIRTYHPTVMRCLYGRAKYSDLRARARANGPDSLD